MGLHDDAEMLDAARAQSVIDERRIVALEAELRALEGEYVDRGRALDAANRVLFTAGEQHGILWRERHDLEQRIQGIRTLCDRARSEAGVTAVPIRIAVQDVLEIIGRHPAITADEHDRSA